MEEGKVVGIPSKDSDLVQSIDGTNRLVPIDWYENGTKDSVERIGGEDRRLLKIETDGVHGGGRGGGGH